MAGLLRRSARTSTELQATLLALASFDRTTLTQYRKAVKSMAQPAWQNETAKRARTPLEVSVLARPARATVSNQNVTLTAGSSSRKMRGGGRPRDLARAVEFGSNRHRQFKEPKRSGYVAYPAAAKMIPRVASLITQTVVRTLLDAIEGKRG